MIIAMNVKGHQVKKSNQGPSEFFKSVVSNCLLVTEHFFKDRSDHNV